MPIGIRVKIEETGGFDPQVIIKILEQKFSNENTQRDLARIKTTVLDQADVFINSNRKRSLEEHDETWRKTTRNNLVNVLRYGSNILSQGKDRWALSIGHKDDLDQFAPYWYKINYGGKIDMKGKQVYGYFGGVGVYGRPMGMGGGDAFHYMSSPIKGKKAWKMTPMKPIPPMYYLEEMAKVFAIEVALLEKQYKKELNSAIKGSSGKKYTK